MADLLHAQEGLLAWPQAKALGMTRRAWDWRFASKRWQQVLPGVALNHTGPATDRERGWAACLYTGAQGQLSGDAALRARGLKGPLSATYDLVVPPSRQVMTCRYADDVEVVVHRIELPARRTSAVRGLPVVDPHTAVLHACAWADNDRAAEWRLAAAVQQRLAAVGPLRVALTEMPRLKRRRLIAEVLDDVEFGAHAASELEFLRFCRRHRLPLPDVMQVKIRVGRIHYLDARYDRVRTTVEVDGAHHRDAGQWEADALRSLRVVAGAPGERVIRITRGNMRHDAEELAGLLRPLLSPP